MPSHTVRFKHWVGVGVLINTIKMEKGLNYVGTCMMCGSDIEDEAVTAYVCVGCEDTIAEESE